MNTALNKSLQMSPYMVMYGHAPRTKLSAAIATSAPLTTIASLHADIAERQAAAVLAIAEAHGASKARYDATSKPRAFEVGDWVLEFTGARDHKMMPNYDGPFRVVECLHGDTYLLEHINSTSTTRAHVRRMVPFNNTRTTEASEIDRFRNPDEHFYVDAILDHKRDASGKYHFLVQWSGPHEPTWEPFSSVHQLDAFKAYSTAKRLPASIR